LEGWYFYDKTNDNTQNTLVKPEYEKGTSLKTRIDLLTAQ
jgi:hypothetical protein